MSNLNLLLLRFNFLNSNRLWESYISLFYSFVFFIIASRIWYASALLTALFTFIIVFLILEMLIFYWILRFNRIVLNSLTVRCFQINYIIIGTFFRSCEPNRFFSLNLFFWFNAASSFGLTTAPSIKCSREESLLFQIQFFWLTIDNAFYF